MNIQIQEKHTRWGDKMITLSMQEAAEDLLLACKEAAVHIREVADLVGADYANSPTFKRIMAAIAKAEGGAA